MKFSITKIGILMLIVGFLLSLTGCGSSSGMGGTETGGGGGTNGIEPEKIQTITLTVDPPSIFGDGKSTAVIRAEVRNQKGQLYQQKISVSFTTSLGTLSAKSANTDKGIAQVILTSPNTVGEAAIAASAGGVFAEEVKVKFIQVPKILALSLSQYTVKSDNSDSSTVTATVLDTNNAPIEGAIVTFTVDGGQISASSAMTDKDGKAVITFSSGTSDRANRNVNITATIAGLTRVIPIQITGSTVVIAPENNIEVVNLEIGGKKEKDTLTVMLKDAGEKPIYGATVNFSSNPTGALRWEPATGYENSFIIDERGNKQWVTDNKGIVKMNIIGAGVAEKAILTVDSLGLKATQAYSVSSLGEVFRIISPEEEIAGIPTNQELRVVVNAPNQSVVRFSTTFGNWENGKKTIDAPVTNRQASARLISNIAGVATVQVIDPNKPTLMDVLNVAIYAPSIEASKIALQASSGVVGLSTDEVKKTVTITAMVKNRADQVVGGAPVAFTIDNATGGGETVSPAIVYTNESGIAKTTFTSGVISSDAKGITIRGFIVGVEPEVSDHISIIIGGTAGSIMIGRSNKVSSVNQDTAYELPMSVLVADSNGNPVPNAKVSIGVWPINYATGFWARCSETSNECCEFRTGIFANEDVNRNLILDPGEDTNGNKELTPLNSAGGTIVIEQADGSSTTGTTGILTTNEKGIGEFKLLYLKSSAAWIEDEITATTIVQGSETQSIYKMWLRPSQEDANECTLPASPYNIQTLAARIALTASPQTLVADDGKSTSIIRATVTDLNTNNVPDGTTVSFTTTTGILEPTSATTKDGKAQVTLKSPKFVGLGNAIVTARADNIEASINIILVPGPPAAIQQRPDAGFKSNLTADGVSTSVIKFRVTDANGNVVQDNLLISFSLPGEGMTGAGNGTLSASNAFTRNGEVSVTYTAPQRIVAAGGQDVSITATYQNVSSAPVIIKLINAVVGQVTVTPGAQKITADGTSTVSIRAEVKDKFGQPVNDGTPVTFSTTAGTFNGGTTTTLYTVGGLVTGMLTSSRIAGTANITVTAGGISGTASIDFIAGKPEKVIVTANPITLTADGKSTSKIKVVVFDANDNPVGNERVTFSAAYGTIDKLFSVTADGVTEVNYTAPASEPPNGIDTVTAKTSNEKNGTAQITLTGPQIGVVTLTANPESIPINGATSTIRATVTIIGGGNVQDGFPVEFSLIPSNMGQITSPKLTANGIATATLTSGTEPGTVTVRAKAGDVIKEIKVDFTPGGVTVLAVPNALLGTGKEKSNLTVTLKKPDGTPASNETVKLTLNDESLGKISTALLTTDSKGEATSTFNASAKGGTAIITATWYSKDDPTKTIAKGTAQVLIHPPPAFIEMPKDITNPNPAEISIKGTGGQSTSQVFFNVKDAQGNPVADGYRIDFRIMTGPDGGEEIAPAFDYTKSIGTGDTAIKGRVGLIVKSGYKSGPISIKATYADDRNVWTSSSEIAIAAGPPVGEAFKPFAEFLNITGMVEVNLLDKISITAADRWGNAIPDNTVISFKTYNTGGFFDPGSSSTKDGIATSTLHSGATDPMCGVISVTAEAVNGGRTTHITSMSIFPENVDNHIIYAGTNGGGVYKSTDSGITWRNISASSSYAGQNWIQSYVNSVAVDPDDKNVVYAATGYLGKGNLYRSLDGGLNWNSNRVKEWYGIFPIDGAVLCVLLDNGSDYVWLGTEIGIFYSKEGGANDSEVVFTRSTLFTGQDNTPFNIKATKIVKVPNSSSGDKAILYAGTANGVYKSEDGGQTWKKTITFVGESVLSIALHPSSDGQTDKIYVGTEDAGVFISMDSGSSWTPWNYGLGKGLSASVPRANDSNKGNGVMGKVKVYRGSLSENWTVRCEEKDIDGGKFSVIGTVSGNQTPTPASYYNIKNGKYVLPNKMEFEIIDGSVDFEVGDTFTFRTTRDPERTIKDLLVDPTNNKLYAITYFDGKLEPHPVGNVYVHNIDLNGAMIGEWREANKNMPQYDPPDDETLFACHVLAREEVNGVTTSLFIGGDGINLMKAKAGLESGSPVWQESKTGLTNAIYARTPILFSETVDMDVAQGIPGKYNETNNRCERITCSGTCDPLVPPKCTYDCVINPFYQDKHFVRIVGGNECVDYFFVYVEDMCGNPPIVGSKLTVRQTVGSTTVDLLLVEYPDTLMHNGTWRDHGYANTNLPYVIRANALRTKLEFIFEPRCTPGVSPGCSGSKITVTY